MCVALFPLFSFFYVPDSNRTRRVGGSGRDHVCQSHGKWQDHTTIDAIREVLNITRKNAANWRREIELRGMKRESEEKVCKRGRGMTVWKLHFRRLTALFLYNRAGS